MEKINYTTDSYSQEDAFAKADIVLTGLLSKIGSNDPEGPGQAYYENSQIDILTVEKGTQAKQSLSIDYKVWTIKNNQLVKKPELGKEYRCYITKVNNKLVAFKITDI